MRVETKTRTPRKLDLGSPGDHTSFPPDPQIAEDNNLGRPRGGNKHIKSLGNQIVHHGHQSVGADLGALLLPSSD